MKNTDYEDVHATTTDIPIENIVSHDNICNDNAHTMAAELYQWKIVSPKVKQS